MNVRFAILVLIGALSFGCGPVEQLEGGEATDHGFEIEVVDARFLDDSMGEQRLYVQAKLTNHSEPEPLVMAGHRMTVITKAGENLKSGFHDPNDPEEIQQCPTNNNGKLVAEGESMACGFVVENEERFIPERLAYTASATGHDYIVYDGFPEDLDGR